MNAASECNCFKLFVRYMRFCKYKDKKKSFILSCYLRVKILGKIKQKKAKEKQNKVDNIDIIPNAVSQLIHVNLSKKI